MEDRIAEILLSQCVSETALAAMAVWIHDSLEACNFCDHRGFECEIKIERIRRILKALVE
jgi:hypothetical protein